MPENLALYAVAGVAATEATGITNFTEIGGAGNDPEDTILPPGAGGMPPGLSEAFGSMAAALSATSGAVGAGRAPVDTSGLSEIIAGQQQQIAALTAGQTGGSHSTDPRELITWAWENTPRPEVPDSGGNGGGYGFTIPGGEGTNIGGLGDGSEFDLQDLAGTSRWGTGLAAGGEIMAETGNLAEDTGNVLITTGNTLSESFKAVTGQEYSAEGTFAEGRRGTATRRINWGEYTPDAPDMSDSPDTVKTAVRTAVDPLGIGSGIASSLQDTKTIPGGTVAAESDGTTEQSPGPVSETEVNAGNYSTGGTGTGITSGSGDVVSSIMEDNKREEPNTGSPMTGGLMR